MQLGKIDMSKVPEGADATDIVRDNIETKESVRATG